MPLEEGTPGKLRFPGAPPVCRHLLTPARRADDRAVRGDRWRIPGARRPAGAGQGACTSLAQTERAPKRPFFLVRPAWAHDCVYNPRRDSVPIT